jgi:SAM-dependent methyltransferase
MTNNIKTFYDSLFADNPSVFGTSSVDFLSRVLDSVPTVSGEALDLGAGEGVTSNLLARHGFEVTAVDISDHAFQSISTELGIKTFVSSFEDFKPTSEYALVHIALVLHHVSEAVATSHIQSLIDRTVPGGMHVLRLFTKNSDFFMQSNGNGFYDDGTNLNRLYDGWEVVIDEHMITPAATQTAQNEIRQVAFKRIA